MKSVMEHSFARLEANSEQRSSFDRSHGLKTTFDAGKLIPIFVDEVLPGDTFNLSSAAFARLATPINPVMDVMHLESFYFFVPSRLVWENHAKFMGERIDPGDSIDFLIPTRDGANASGSAFAEGSMADYFGIPTGETNINVNVLPFRCMDQIWNEWFRDENLQDSVIKYIDDTPTFASNEVYPRGKRHDYFTSCLPSPQKGDPVQLPLGERADVLGIRNRRGSALTEEVTGYETGGTGIADGAPGWIIKDIINTPSSGETWITVNAKAEDSIFPDVYADLTTAVGSTINEFREAMATQEFLERDMRGGTRYTELIRAHFGVNSPDARLQRPEYLGGGSTPININPVAQTSSTDVTTPQGNLSAFGTGSFSNHGFTKSFTEHGYIIGLINVRADLTYQQGLNKMWSRQSRLDFYWPEFAHLGEQAVLNKEIYSKGDANDDLVFGYQERWAEYRFKPSIITGAFRSNAAAPLDSWHLAQDFGSLPALNASFIEDNPPIDRIIAVPSEPQFIMDMYFSLKCARLMPTYSIPGLKATRF